MGPTFIQVILDEHSSLAAMLRSLRMLVAQGPGDQPERFFDVLRAMLFYIDEYPEQRHHPKESDLLFPKLARARPPLMPAIRKLEADHIAGEGKVRALQHLLIAWELFGEPRRQAFVAAAEAYVDFYLAHMRQEELELMAVAADVLTAQEIRELDTAFASDRDPLAGGERDSSFERLFTRILMAAPAPIGVGPQLSGEGQCVSAGSR